MLRLGWRCSGFQYSPGCISLQSCSNLRGVCSLHHSFHIYGVTRKNTELQYWVDQQSLKITAGKNVIEKIQDCCHVNVLVYVFRYKHMFWWGFACVLHSSLKYSSLQMQRDTWSRAMGSFSSAFEVQQCHVLMSSEGTALLRAHPPEQCPCRLLQGSGPQPCHRLILSSVWSSVEQRTGFSWGSKRVSAL